MDRAAFFERSAAWLAGGHLAIVESLKDPDHLNRVQVKLVAYDGVDGQNIPLWARVVAPFAGDDRGTFFFPDEGDEVLVVFVQGDPRYPLIVGGLWSGKNKSPASIESSGENKLKRIKSKNGIQITLDDTQGKETLTMETPGKQKITLKDGPGEILIEDSNGNSVKLHTGGIDVVAGATVKVQAAKVDVTAGMVNVDTAMAKFSGVVKCEVLQATMVVGTSYTPGVGNVW